MFLVEEKSQTMYDMSRGIIRQETVERERSTSVESLVCAQQPLCRPKAGDFRLWSDSLVSTTCPKMVTARLRSLTASTASDSGFWNRDYYGS